MTLGNGSLPPSNGNASDAASILLGMELGQHRHRMDSLEGLLRSLARGHSLHGECLILLLKLCATHSRIPTTSSQMETAKSASTGMPLAPTSTLWRLLRKGAVELVFWLAPKLGMWLWPYLLAGVGFLYALLRGYAKFLGASFG